MKQFNISRTRDEKGDFANNADLDEVAHNEVAHNEPPHLDLHCLPSSLRILNIIQLELHILKICRRKFSRVCFSFRHLKSLSVLP